MSTDRTETTDTTETTETAAARPYIGFRPGLLTDDLDERAGSAQAPTRALVAKRDLERYYTILAQSLPTFTEAEASLIADALDGEVIEARSAKLLWARVDDAAAKDNLDRKWNVDTLALVSRLRALTPFESLAVADAVERFWNGGFSDFTEGLRQVGLIRAK